MANHVRKGHSFKVFKTMEGYGFNCALLLVLIDIVNGDGVTMYYKIKNNILFRKYEGYGYITDNSMFGYRMSRDTSLYPGEEFISESGAVMLNQLNKTPQHLDDIVDKLLSIFVDVESDELKHDTAEFFDMFVKAGFLSRGESFGECNNIDNLNIGTIENVEPTTPIVSSDCSKIVFNQNDFLRSLHIEITNECNERCVHCYIPHGFKTKSIDSELFYRIVEEGRNMNIINVTLSGGEPLLHKDIIFFLKRCRELDLSVNVLTNLTLLTDDIIYEMKMNPLLCVQTSIYSMNSSIHDSITNVKGSFEKTKYNLLKLKELGIPVQISCPLMKQNKDTFNEVIAFGKENGISVSVDYVIFASYDHSNGNLTNRLSLAEIGQAFDKQATEEYVSHLIDQAAEKNSLTAQDSICSICRYYICISAQGDAFPCIGWQANVIGNLNIQSLREIWESSDDIKKLRQIKWNNFPKCLSCEDRGYCNVCMMSNSNENCDGDAFRINEFHCNVAALIHKKINSYLDDKRY